MRLDSGQFPFKLPHVHHRRMSCRALAELGCPEIMGQDIGISMPVTMFGVFEIRIVPGSGPQKRDPFPDVPAHAGAREAAATFVEKLDDVPVSDPACSCIVRVDQDRLPTGNLLRQAESAVVMLAVKPGAGLTGNQGQRERIPGRCGRPGARRVPERVPGTIRKVETSNGLRKKLDPAARRRTRTSLGVRPEFREKDPVRRRIGKFHDVAGHEGFPVRKFDSRVPSCNRGSPPKDARASHRPTARRCIRPANRGVPTIRRRSRIQPVRFRAAA